MKKYSFEEESPSLKSQWEGLRKQIPENGAVLLIRLGEYYESFFSDSEVVSGVCSQPVTEWGTRTMCGFHFREFEAVMQNFRKCEIRVFLTNDRVKIEEIV